MERETLVLLPGMMCTAELFAPQIAHFREDYEIVVPTLSQNSIGGMAEAVLNSVQAESFNVVGLSMGGIVSMVMAGVAPERIKRLALLDTNHHADAIEKYDVRNRQIEDVRNGKLREVIVDEMKPVYLAKPNRDDQPLLNRLIKMAMECGPDVFVSQSIALRDRSDNSEALKNYHGPALVLCGEEDALCPLERHQEIANLLPNAKSEVIPDAGHITTLEAPILVNRTLHTWLQRTPLI